jgi:hypothetical protein
VAQPTFKKEDKMKKRLRKLTLNRETLRHLQADDVRRAVGGTGTTFEDWTGCACSDSCYCGGTGGCTQGCTGGTATETGMDWTCCDC